MFSLNQHKINRGDNWRAFKLVCDQEDLPPLPPAAVLMLQPWDFGRSQHNISPNLAKHLLTFFLKAPEIPRLLSLGRQLAVVSRTQQSCRW